MQPCECCQLLTDLTARVSAVLDTDLIGVTVPLCGNCIVMLRRADWRITEVDRTKASPQ